MVKNQCLSVVYGSITLNFFVASVDTSGQTAEEQNLKKVCFLGHPNAYIPCDRQETMLTESGGLPTLLSDHQQHQNQDQVATKNVISCHWKNALLSWGPCWGWDLKVVKRGGGGCKKPQGFFINNAFWRMFHYDVEPPKDALKSRECSQLLFSRWYPIQPCLSETGWNVSLTFQFTPQVGETRFGEFWKEAFPTMGTTEGKQKAEDVV